MRTETALQNILFNLRSTGYDNEIRSLKTKRLIEGRRPNFHISATIANDTVEKADCIRQRGIDDDYCEKIILDYLIEFDEGKREDFESIFLDMLPDFLDLKQKQNKIKNILQKMKRRRKIRVGDERQWVLDEI